MRCAVSARKNGVSGRGTQCGKHRCLALTRHANRANDAKLIEHKGNG